jgi:dihydroneopterin aldolase
VAALELRNIRVVAVHGVLPEERERAQPFDFDLTVAFDMAPSARSDELNDTLDYALVLQTAVDVVLGPPCNLLEHLAHKIGDAVLRIDTRVTAVEVALRKTRPPVAHDLASAGVRLTVSR